MKHLFFIVLIFALLGKTFSQDVLKISNGKRFKIFNVTQELSIHTLVGKNDTLYGTYIGNITSLKSDSIVFKPTRSNETLVFKGKEKFLIHKDYLEDSVPVINLGIKNITRIRQERFILNNICVVIEIASIATGLIVSPLIALNYNNNRIGFDFAKYGVVTGGSIATGIITGIIHSTFRYKKYNVNGKKNSWKITS